MKHIEKTIVIDQKDDSGCIRCGKCCKLLHVRTFDIEKIKKATGLKESEFTELHPFTEKRILKTKCDPVDKDIYCMFLERLDDGTTSCTYTKIDHGYAVSILMMIYVKMKESYIREFMP